MPPKKWLHVGLLDPAIGACQCGEGLKVLASLEKEGSYIMTCPKAWNDRCQIKPIGMDFAPPNVQEAVRKLIASNPPSAQAPPAPQRQYGATDFVPASRIPSAVDPRVMEELSAVRIAVNDLKGEVASMASSLASMASALHWLQESVRALPGAAERMPDPDRPRPRGPLHPEPLKTDAFYGGGGEEAASRKRPTSPLLVDAPAPQRRRSPPAIAAETVPETPPPPSHQKYQPFWPNLGERKEQ